MLDTNGRPSHMAGQGGRAVSVMVSAVIIAALTSPAAAAPDPCSGTLNDEGIVACTQAIDTGLRTGRDLATAYVSRGRAYFARADMGLALSDFNRAIRADPGYAPGYDGRGLFFKFHPARAIADFDQAIRLDADDADAHIHRAAAYRLAGQLDRALADETAAIRIAPDNAEAFRGRGRTLRAMGKLDPAIADFSEAIRLAPDDKYGYFDRGGAYEAKGDLDRAIADYTETIRRGPFTHAYEVRGDAYAVKGDFDRAIADDDAAIRRIPDDAAALHSRGVARQAKGDAAGGAADLARARQLTTTAGLPIGALQAMFRAAGAIAILCGAVLLFAMLSSRRMPATTALFFAGTIVAGALLPQASDPPPLPTIAAAAVILAVALLAYYAGHLKGHWRWIYVIAMLAMLYLEVHTALVEALLGWPSLLLLLPLSAEPPYVRLQLALIAVFVVSCAAALRVFRPPGATVAQTMIRSSRIAS